MLNVVRSTVVSAGDLVNNMASTLQVCEPLCFIQSNIGTGNTPKSAVQTTLIGFYTDEDICIAKELSFSFAEKCSPKIDHLPRNRARRTDESKRRLDVEDLLSLYDFHDKRKIPPPTFVAANSTVCRVFFLMEWTSTSSFSPSVPSAQS